VLLAGRVSEVLNFTKNEVPTLILSAAPSSRIISRELRGVGASVKGIFPKIRFSSTMWLFLKSFNWNIFEDDLKVGF